VLGNPALTRKGKEKRRENFTRGGLFEGTLGGAEKGVVSYAAALHRHQGGITSVGKMLTKKGKRLDFREAGKIGGDALATKEGLLLEDSRKRAGIRNKKKAEGKIQGKSNLLDWGKDDPET